MSGAPGTAPRSHAAGEPEPDRVAAIRNRRRSPGDYIEYQRLTGAVLFDRMARWMTVTGARVLEVGCGPAGIILEGAARGVRAHGIDRDQYDSPLPAARDYARTHALELALLRADAARLPYRDHAFDAVIASSVIEHFDDPAGALREMRRVMKPGAFAFVDFPLFHGPFGGHIDDVLPWPWLHLASDGFVKARLEARGATFEYGVYRSLNRITRRVFVAAVRESGLEIAEFRRLHFITHPGRKLLVGLLGAGKQGSPAAVWRALAATPKDFKASEVLLFPLLLAMAALSYVPLVDEFALTGVRYVLRRPAL